MAAVRHCTPRAGRGYTGTAPQAGAGLAYRASTGARDSTALGARAQPEPTRRMQRCQVLGPWLPLLGSLHIAHSQPLLHKLRLVPSAVLAAWAVPCSKGDLDPGP